VAQVLIYTDPHLGLKRKANFTPASAAAREKEAITSLLSLVREASEEGHTVICAGDFFDKANNSEDVIDSTLEIAMYTDFILAGNHDVKNNVEAVSSLDIVNQVHDNVLFSDPDGYHQIDIGDWEFVFIPHVMSQKRFIEILDHLPVVFSDMQKGVLILHCNYDTLCSEDDIHLTLTRPIAEKLLTKFNYIFIGHEHTAKEDFDGRLKLIGSFRPTAFDNLDEKSVIIFDTETGTANRRVVWEPSVYVGPASGAALEPGKQYYDIEDDLEVGSIQSLVVSLMSKGAFGVRIRSTAQNKDLEEIDYKSIEFLPEVVVNDIQKHEPDLLDTYNTLLKSIQA
jgi:DNA repair exonuclease SbcCD nuclease subunit